MGTRTKLRQSDLRRPFRAGQHSALNAPLDADSRPDDDYCGNGPPGPSPKSEAAYTGQVATAPRGAGLHAPSAEGPEFRFTKYNGEWSIKAWDAPHAKAGDEVVVESRNGSKQLILGTLVHVDRRLRVFAIQRDAKPQQQKIQFRDDVPEGRYAVTGDDGSTDFYKVDRPTEGRWAGYVFVKLVVGGDQGEQRLQVKQQATVLDRIAKAGVQQAMVRYGQEIGECGHCGRTLTDEASRAKGIGPVCEAKLGW